MNWFDRDLLTWMNGFSRVSYPFDVTVAAIATSNALKGGLATVLLAWFWFAESKDQRRTRQVIVATFVAAAVAILAGRLLATVLPFRIRPAHNPVLGFVQPYGYPDVLRGWSAFPSDHAMLFMAVATGLWFLSRRLGAAAYVYVVVLVLAPRVYLGMHHPTDVLFGALLGIVLAAAANTEAVRRRLTTIPLRWSTAHAPSFYAAAFVVALQVATMFDAPRQLLRQVKEAVQARPVATLPVRASAGSERAPSLPDALVPSGTAPPEQARRGGPKVERREVRAGTVIEPTVYRP